MSARAITPGLAGPVPTAWLGIGFAAAVAAAATAVLLGPVALAVPLVLGLVYLMVRFPPFLLVCYGYVGIFKGQPELAALPFDATVALGVLLFGVCLIRLLEGRARPVPAPYLTLLLLIGVMLAVALLWTPMLQYGTEKTLKFVSFTALAALSPFFIIEDRRDVRTLLWGTVALALFGAAVALAYPGGSESGRIEFGGNENTIFTSRLLCAGALVLLVAPGLGVPRRLRIAGPVLGIGLVVVAAGVGSRGPIVALALALACVIAASVVRSPRQLLSVLVIVAVGIAIFPLIKLPETSKERLQNTVDNPVMTLEQDGRSRFYSKAIELTGEHPLFGFGTGGFFLFSYVLMDQEEQYPHNIFLELSSELGLGPPIALAVVILYVLLMLGRRAWRAETDVDRRMIFVVGGLFLNNLFAVQFSGDINDNRVFWAMFGVALLLARYGIPSRDRGPWLGLRHAERPASSLATADR
jgi:O-Antigen ligase